MRGHIQLYHQPATANRYSIVEICVLVDTGMIAAKPASERKRMRQILKSNAEAQEGYAQKQTDVKLIAAHLEMAKKLKKYRLKIGVT